MAYVPAEGSRDAEIAFIGEGPGSHEMRQGRPFVGPTGGELDELLGRAGLLRHQVYLTNVIKDSTNTPTDDDIQRALPMLTRELTTLPNCKVFVPLGVKALCALSAWRYQSMKPWRGSILEPFFGGKMVPTYHPAWYMRGEWRYKPVVLEDIRRAARESKRWGIHRPEREYIIAPNLTQVLATLASYEAEPFITVDIETFGTHIACIGFAKSPTHGICVPLLRSHWQPYWQPHEEMLVWRAIARLLAAPNRKGFQNGIFDCGKLADFGVEVRNFWFDTMLAHHLLYSELPHGLDFITSIYTDEPYYKEEGKKWTHGMPEEQLWLYNLKDCFTTYEAALAMEAELHEAGIWDYYQTFVMRLVSPLLRMNKRGIQVDVASLATIRGELQTDIGIKQAELDGLLGWHCNVKAKSDLMRFLAQRGIKPTRFTEKGNPKTDEETLRVYEGRDPCREFELIFDITEKRTLVSGFLGMALDPSGRYHPSYLIHGTRTGRLSARGGEDKNRKKGPQIQNIPPYARRVFVARPGYELVEADERQAEAMIVAFLARDRAMQDFFLNKRDIHKYVASIIFGISEGSVTDAQRQIAKRIAHGTNYKMGPRKLVAVLGLEGIHISEADAKRYQAIYFSHFVGIPQWHNEVQVAIRTTRRLVTPFGRPRIFLGAMDDKTLREAVAHVPQSTVGEIAERALITLDDTLPDDCYIVTEVHDNIVIEAPMHKRQLVMALMQQAFDIPLTIHGQTFTVPVEFKVGSNWGAMQKVAA